ncbi:MAG: hypothetical protein GY822_22365 [Deltaproteobacteria bacterium]|nr:hypothetical protein [Deltaproteobacteria bacterium]
MTLRPLSLRPQISGNGSSGQSFTASVALVVLLALCGCPQSASTNDENKGPKWKKLDVELPDDLQKLRSEREKLRESQQKNARHQMAKSRVEKMQEIFVKADEQQCLADDDCVITPAHCCDCSAGGSLVAINKFRLPALLSRRVSLCSTTQCAQSLSTSPTCNSTVATCKKGVCKLASEAASPPAKGIGVESIPEARPTP